MVHAMLGPVLETQHTHIHAHTEIVLQTMLAPVLMEASS
jgi:hypothetical protein